MKKIVALVLSLVMVLGLATTAFAATTSTGSVATSSVTPVKAELYSLATTAGGSMALSDDTIAKIEVTTITGMIVEDVPMYVPTIYAIDGDFYVEVAKADAGYALKNNGEYVWLHDTAGTSVDVIVKAYATAVVLDQYVAAAEDVECGDAVKGTKGAAIYKSGTDAYYADGSNWAYFNGEFVKYDKNTKVAFKAHTWDKDSVIVKDTDVKGVKVPVSIECSACEKTFAVVSADQFDNTWVKFVNYDTTAAVKDYFIVLDGATDANTPDAPAAEGDKVESAETFDAGIAMYVGMSVMAAAGSAVVLKKKD